MKKRNLRVVVVICAFQVIFGILLCVLVARVGDAQTVNTVALVYSMCMTLLNIFVLP